MTKGFKIQSQDLAVKVNVVVRALYQVFGDLSDTEMAVLVEIVGYSAGNTLTITTDISKSIKQITGVTDTSFSTTLHRLEKKKVFDRLSKTITLHPAFKDINDMTKLVVSFNPQ